MQGRRAPKGIIKAPLAQTIGREKMNESFMNSQTEIRDGTQPTRKKKGTKKRKRDYPEGVNEGGKKKKG